MQLIVGNCVSSSNAVLLLKKKQNLVKLFGSVNPDKKYFWKREAILYKHLLVLFVKLVW